MTQVVALAVYVLHPTSNTHDTMVQVVPRVYNTVTSYGDSINCYQYEQCDRLYFEYYKINVTTILLIFQKI